jgi:hypothetical protein
VEPAVPKRALTDTALVTGLIGCRFRTQWFNTKSVIYELQDAKMPWHYVMVPGHFIVDDRVI